MDITDFESSPMMRDFPEALRRYLGLAPRETIAHAPTVRGVTRLFTCPSLEPIEALTLTFYDVEVGVSHVVSDDDVWERIACGEEPSDDTQFLQCDRSFSVSDLPTLVQGWQRVVDAVRNAKSCMSDNPEGISFYHLAFGIGVDSTRVWFNPTETADPLQIALIGAYARIKALLSM